MRRTLCALFLLLFCPAAALAQPAVDITSPDEGLRTKDATVTVVATVTGATGTLAVKVGSVTASANDANTPDVFTASNVPLVSGPNTLTVTATDSDDPNNPGTADVHVTRLPFAVILQPDDPNLAGLQFTTDNDFVIVTGTVDDPDPNGTISLNTGFFSNFTAKLSGTPPDLTFSGRVNLAEGDTTIKAIYTDENGKVTNSAPLTVTRTVVCTTKTPFPAPGDPNDASAPQNYVVDRNDDLPDADLIDDPNCDIRPQFRPIPSDPNDQPVQPPGNVGHCTLRAAIEQANAHPGPDTITLSGTRKIVLTRTGPKDPNNPADRGDLTITGPTRIAGPDGGRDGIIIDGKKLGNRVFDFEPNDPSARLEIVNLTIQGGRTPKPNKNDPNSTLESGGCIRSSGDLFMANVAVLSCSSDTTGGAIALEGGNGEINCGIIARNKAKTNGGAISSNVTPLELRNSTLSINSASQRGGGVSMVGGESELDLTLSNDTFSQNKAKAGGGALDLGSQVKATINNLTFANNSAKLGSSISATPDATVEFSNTILGDKSKSSCDPNSPVDSLGNNIELGDSCHLQGSLGDKANTDPLLQPLATNFGTPTHLLRDGSPAIDHGGFDQNGVHVPCTTLDQRNVERGAWPPDDPNSCKSAIPACCDIGAVELRTAPSQ
jgi:hypothetical protein